jgi:hypothetical protein
MINLIVPLIFGTACIIISIILISDYKRRKKNEQLKKWFENEN